MPKKMKLNEGTAAAQKRLLERDAEQRKNGMNRSQVSYIIAYKDDKPSCEPMVDRSCFGGLLDRTTNGRSQHAVVGSIVGFISLIIPARLTAMWPGHPRLLIKDRDQWLQWVLNDSPWKAAFRTKSVPTALKSGIVCHVNVPSNFLISGLMAIRAVTDNTRKIIVWAELVKYGMDETYAYFASHFFTPTRKKFQRDHSLGFRGQIVPSAEHMALGHYFFRSLTPMKNFLNGLVVHPRAAFKENTIFTISGRSIHNLWGRGFQRDVWTLDCPLIVELKKKANTVVVKVAGWSTSDMTIMTAAGATGAALPSHHTVYHTPDDKKKLVASITKQLDTIKAG